jgi:methionine-rich copper-binding protein CopC
MAALAMAAAMAAAAIALPSRARAHAFPSGEEPRVGCTTDHPPPRVAITFDSPIELMFAKLQVTDAEGRDVTAGPPARSDDHRVLSVPVKPLGPGDYRVRWAVVAEDGHRTEGSYLFTVAAPQ